MSVHRGGLRYRQPLRIEGGDRKEGRGPRNGNKLQERVKERV